MKTCSIFCQLLQLVPRTTFERLERETGAGKGLKGFSCWEQFVAMLFCQLGHAHTLREISGGLAACAGKIVHLNLKKAPSRSTLSHANAHHSPKLFEALFYALLQRFTAEHLGHHRFRFKHKLLSLDATLIELCLSVFDWAHYRRAKGAIKLHLLLDHDGYLPCFMDLTDGRHHELPVARMMRFAPGTIVVFDRAYNDYAWYDQLTQQGVFFVTRLKRGADYAVVEEYELPRRRHLLGDDDIELGARRRHRYRRVRWWDEERQVELEFLTNNLKLSAATIAAIYKDRWQIETFFKALKQNLKIKTFLGTTPNAVLTQIWTALIAILLLKYMQLKATHRWSLSDLAKMLRYNLFVHRDFWAWLNQPYCPPPEVPPDGQMVLEFG